mmetsp:Transcript_29061/g.70887  ORF Transcript_29061/g.70887 Transcript_29061/m.70887 type:complete len:193 (+) Transcript_29061:143-721(+)|eukprot:CAMPEP_0114510366 /NCGR_PEP_ID=MMETSP0109-20121206/13744_1 /TAXON_ID=29199 /ORGANISM="Chlorarachnion reptans, Strain CCCM449" /LENGTH=192 /DNA_ID=CAMNT_0001689659 /DNA_START=131 /DNA_END=709 /DNA_ORIENTATION=-
MALAPCTLRIPFLPLLLLPTLVDATRMVTGPRGVEANRPINVIRGGRPSRRNEPSRVAPTTSSDASRRQMLRSLLLSGAGVNLLLPKMSQATNPVPGGPGISDEYVAELKRRKAERCKYRGGCPDVGRIFTERGYVEYFHTLNKEIIRNPDGSYEIITMKEARQQKKEGKLRSEKVGYLPFGDIEILVRNEN